MTTDIHSCGPFCTRPACVLAQRDELRTENAALRELMNAYNLGGWTDSLRLIKERDELRAQVEVMLEALGKIAQFDPYEPAGPAANAARTAINAAKGKP